MIFNFIKTDFYNIQNFIKIKNRLGPAKDQYKTGIIGGIGVGFQIRFIVLSPDFGMKPATSG